MRGHQYRDRASNQLREEPLLSREIQEFFLHHPLGRRLAGNRSFTLVLSALYGRFQDSRFSARKVDKIAREFAIELGDFEGAPFASFNEFFKRRFRPGLRPFPEDKTLLGSPAEGRLLAFDQLDTAEHLQIKGQRWDLGSLLGGEERAGDLVSASVLVLRLSPGDYHRFHACEDLRIAWRSPIAGGLRTVNPAGAGPRVFFENRRIAFGTESKALGSAAWVAVGGFCVGRIYLRDECDVAKSAELGWFEMGGSTLIVILDPKRVQIDEDLLQASRAGVETFIRLGEPIARFREAPLAR